MIVNVGCLGENSVLLEIVVFNWTHTDLSCVYVCRKTPCSTISMIIIIIIRRRIRCFTDEAHSSVLVVYELKFSLGAFLVAQ